MHSQTLCARPSASRVAGKRFARAFAAALVSLASLGAAVGCGAGPASSPLVELPAPGDTRGAPSEAAAEPLSPQALLTRLPRDAAAYLATRPADFDLPTAPLLVHALRDGGVGRLFGEARSIAALLAAMHIDPTRPIVVAASAPTRGSGAEIVGLLSTDEPWEELAPRIEAMAPIASTYRVVAPLEPRGGALVDAALRDEAVASLRAMFQRVRIETKLCPGDPRCARFGLERPSFLVVRAPWFGAVFVEGASAELELARTRLWSADSLGTWDLLAEARKAERGGPQPGRCASVEPASAAWVCVDADRFASYGTAEGHLTVADALSGFGFDPGERATIAEQGRREVARIAELARPQSALLDRGSASLRFVGTEYTLDARWRTSERSRPSVERALARRTCGTLGEPAPFFDALRAAFPDPGPDFADPRAARERLLESGWGGQGVAFARTWPNLLSGGPGELRTLARELGLGEACAAHEAGELRLELRGRAPWGEKR